MTSPPTGSLWQPGLCQQLTGCLHLPLFVHMTHQAVMAYTTQHGWFSLLSRSVSHPYLEQQPTYWCSWFYLHFHCRCHSSVVLDSFCSSGMADEELPYELQVNEISTWINQFREDDISPEVYLSPTFLRYFPVAVEPRVVVDIL